MHSCRIQCCLVNLVITLFDVMVNSRTFKDLCNEIKGLSSTVLFSSTFKALNLGEKNSSSFKDFQGRVGTLCSVREILRGN